LSILYAKVGLVPFQARGIYQSHSSRCRRARSSVSRTCLVHQRSPHSGPTSYRLNKVTNQLSEITFSDSECLRLSEFLMCSRQNFSDRFLILRSSTAPSGLDGVRQTSCAGIFPGGRQGMLGRGRPSIRSKRGPLRASTSWARSCSTLQIARAEFVAPFPMPCSTNTRWRP
jgi:hypothetical protein